MRHSKADKTARFTDRLWRRTHSAESASQLQGKANTALSDAMRLIKAQREASS